MKKLKLYISVGIAILLQTCSTYAHKPTEHNKLYYTVGIAPQFNARKIQTIWRPILKELEIRTNIHLTLRGTATISKFEQEFMAGQFDFAYTNPYRTLMAQKTQGYIPLVRDVARQLYGVLVVRKDSPIKSVHELDGKTIAFPAPNSMGASLMVRSDLKKLFNIKFNPLYSQSHNSSYLNVVLGKADAGGGVQKTFNRQDKNIKDKLRILHETTRVPPHPFSVHPRIPKQVAEKIKQALLDMGKTEEGRSLLAAIPVKQIGPATTGDYESLLKMGLEEFNVR